MENPRAAQSARGCPYQILEKEGVSPSLPSAGNQPYGNTSQ